MKALTSLALLTAGLVLLACSTGSSSEDSEGRKVVQREEVPDSRFVSASLESTIEKLVANVETADSDEDLAFGVILKELDGFWRPIAVGAGRAIGELGVIGQVQGSTIQEQNEEQQTSFLEEHLDNGIDGLAIAPEVDALSEYTDQLSDDGKPVVTIDSDMPESKRDIFIGTDNQNAGTTGGETLLELLGDAEGHVIVLGNTDKSWSAGYTRTFAAVDVLEEAGLDVTVLSSKWDAEEEVAQVREAMTSLDGPLVGMLGVFANAHALGTAVLEEDPEEKPRIVAFDFEPDTLSYMEQGLISATHVQRQYYMGYLSVYVMYSIHAVGLEATKQTLGDTLIDGFHLDTGLDVIRAQDLDEYNAFNEELGI